MNLQAATTARRLVDGWGRRVHERALDNARAAATEVSRRRVEAAEVEAFLAGRPAHARPAARAL
jgi:hypothetical protein